jgi:hypothetical protein
MPYRRLPNTDVARMKAMEKADQKGSELPPFKLAYSQKTYNSVKLFLPKFKKAMLLFKLAYSNQVGKNKDYLNELRKARIYISHFIQVLNMSVQRGELPAAIKIYFGLEEKSKKIPSLITEEDVIKWGQRIIDGETQRINKGMSPITNPTIALVKVHYENYMDAYRYQKNLQKTYSRSQQELADLRKTADSIILNIWNEVEETFKNETEPERRKLCEAYGLVYVFRKNEIREVQIKENSMSGIG